MKNLDTAFTTIKNCFENCYAKEIFEIDVFTSNIDKEKRYYCKLLREFTHNHKLCNCETKENVRTALEIEKLI